MLTAKAGEVHGRRAYATGASIFCSVCTMKDLTIFPLIDSDPVYVSTLFMSLWGGRARDPPLPD